MLCGSPSLEAADRRLEPASVWFAALCLIYVLHCQFMQDNGSTLSAGGTGFAGSELLRESDQHSLLGPPPRTACNMLPVGFYTYSPPCRNLSHSNIIKAINNSWIGPLGLWSLLTIPGEDKRLPSRHPSGGSALIGCGRSARFPKAHHFQCNSFSAKPQAL